MPLNFYMHDEEKCRKNLHRMDVSPDDWSPALERGQGFFVLVNLTNQGEFGCIMTPQ